MRILLGILAGIVVAFATIWIVDLGGHSLYPVPSDLNLRDYEAIGSFIQSMPPLVLFIVALAWFLGAALGGYVAAAVSQRDWTIWVIAGLVVVGGILNIMMIPHPLVLQIGAFVAPLIGGVVAHALYRRSRATA